jgi:large subunit ribosomal protein L21
MRELKMYAIVEQAGVQFRVSEGDVIEVPRMHSKIGDKIQLEKVLLVADGEKFSVGKPEVDKATVKAEVVGEDRAKKVVVFKYKPKKSYARMMGHRQDFTRIKITGISL